MVVCQKQLQEEKVESLCEVDVANKAPTGVSQPTKILLLAARLAEGDGRIQCDNDCGDTFYGKANVISSNAAEVVPGCSMILFALPTDRHEVYLKSMRHFLQQQQEHEGSIPLMIGSMPGEGGFDLCVRNTLGPEIASKSILFSLETLPWACRVEQFGRFVRVLGTKQDIDLCVCPGTMLHKVRDLLQAMVGKAPRIEGSPSSNFLGVSLMNPNAIAHPCIEYGLLRDWDGKTPFKTPPLFYQGVDNFTAETIEKVSHEIIQVKAAILKRYPSMDLALVRTLTEFFEACYYDDIADHSSLRNMFLTNKGYDGLAMPTTRTESGEYLPLFEHRYFSEDLPCGILVQRGIAELANVDTPEIDKVIRWCQEKVGKDYLSKNGKLEGKDIAKTKIPQRYGFKDLESFVEVNGYATR
mmetsp:Transcript_21671/g.60153  ORF Transcript_21671/g.60153 Transcript_21671/m.60153 type:complete len:412 (-) Transcript_21671:3198-4433(-)